MSDLNAIIQNQIKRLGVISLSDFMSLALYHPEHGYYKKPNRIGATGDFITAPEISQAFGEIIALWFIDHWQRHFQGEQICFLELGPGRGTLLADILQTAKAFPDFEKALSLYCLETNPAHIDEIKTKLPDSEMTFIHSPAEMPEAPLFFVANEFFDALPIKQYQFQKNHWHERMIGLSENDEMTFALRPHPLPLPRDIKAKENDILEINQSMISLAGSLFDHIKTFKGAGLIIDYGYEEQHMHSTLQAVRAHQKADIFDDIGETDLTTHIDFKALIDLAQKFDIQDFALTTQGDFLSQNGIFERAKILSKSLDDEAKETLSSQIKRLTDPDQMGELFKVFSVNCEG